MTHVKTLQAGHSSQGTSEPITPVSQTACFHIHIEHNYIPEKRKFSGILCFRQQRSRRRRPPPPRHNFVVSAITFEGFKLCSSNLTHALFIQISRTSSITDIVVQSKMADGGHFVQKLKKKSCVSI